MTFRRGTAVTYTATVFLLIAVLVADVWADIDYRIWANVGLLGVAALANAFTLLYLLRSKWWTNRIGKIYLTKCLVLSLVLDQIVLAIWWDTEYPGRQHVRFVIYTMGAVVYVPMLVSLWREQQRDRHAVRETDHHNPPA